jgi:hypothetical protein
MPTVVIIHAADDTLPARALAEKLRQAAKLTVVLEKPPGEELRAAVRDAAVAIALWSPRSVTQPALAEDVAFGRGKTKVLHALMQSAQAPEQFRNEKAVNLTGWRGEDDFASWRELAKAVSDKAGVALAPPPPPRPPSGFFQPGRPSDTAAAQPGRPQARGSQQQRQQARPAAQAAPPRPAPRAAPRQSAAAAEPAAEKTGGGRTIMIAAIALVVAIAGGGGYWFWSQSQSAQASSTAWENVERNNASALRAFIAGSPGQFRDEAQATLAELEERTYEAASDADTVEALEAFLSDFPESEHAIAARGRIAELQSLPEAPVEEAPLGADETAPVDPDLVPPGTTPEATVGGPATLTPPPVEEPPSEEPGDAPTN